MQSTDIQCDIPISHRNKNKNFTYLYKIYKTPISKQRMEPGGFPTSDTVHKARQYGVPGEP